jgi:O-antigen/teichoic acid export membrane protein
MGIIKRQGIKQSIVSYVGVVIGFASTLWIYSLDEEIYGLVRFLLSGATFLGAFAFLGTTSWTIRFFSIFQNKENGHNGFLPILLITSSAAFLLFIALVLIFQDSFLALLGFLDMKPQLYSENFLYIAILSYLIVMAGMLSSFISNFQRIVIPELLTNLFLKVSVPALVLAYFLGFLDRQVFVFWFIVAHLIILLGLFLYTWKIGQFSLKLNLAFLKKGLLKEMGNYSFFSILGAIGSQLATRLDLIMIASLLPSFGSVGIYAIALNIASVIEVPYRSFSKIAAPIIAKENESNNRAEVLDLYQRSSIALLIAGLLLFACVWISVDQLFLLTSKPATLTAGKYVILYIGIAKVIDMATGINGQIIAYSKYYRVNVIAILILAVINVLANYYLIPIYGITGAAMATMISLGTFNVFKFIYVWVVFKMQPFTSKALFVLLLVNLCFGLANLIPLTPFVLINIMLRSGILAVLFIGAVVYFDFSKDISKLFYETWAKIKSLWP